MRRRSKGKNTPITLFSFQDLITSLSGILILIVLLMALEIALRKNAGAVTVPKDKQDHSAVIESFRNNVAKLQQDYAKLKQSIDSAPRVDAVEHFRQVTEIESKEKEINTLNQHINKLKAKKTVFEKRLQDIKKKKEQLAKEEQPLIEELVKLRKELKKMAGNREIFFIPEKGSSKIPILVECSDKAIRMGVIGRNEKPAVFKPDSDGKRGFEKYISRYSKTREYFVFMIKPSGAKYWGIFGLTVKSQGFDVGYDALEENSSIGYTASNL